ncbi:HpcH/HpaI aldolase/citrate lyase family protein [Aestuariicoccus sp. MJ-SS9]|uniref:HpcH/HpaI aldolase family protein n=1 Tax=Aestuariicoccus sp. MJ-SS9 TaxID=3079855 RepID=UPI00290C5E2B|nr:HpcH/HpaI aldolase/citrate lyase family protein [Aestuariicoccus sp. MJ-SS9]MDU8910219.1 HpcH/HpaI aldolase/citrate lyase family protein [Aestuariicoccus sp. MJ-SS9]
MPAPQNAFKRQLASGQRSIGCWMCLCDPYVAEIVARAGFDWVLIDGEHAPNDLVTITRQLQVVDPHCAPLVRLPMAEPWLIKQVLDAGAQNLLIPMVNSTDDARAIVRAMRYPPQGIRGVGHALGRASRFGAEADYARNANDELCLIVQIESVAATEALDDILAVEGVDAAFIGPADLAADMGLTPDAAEAQALVATTLRRIAEAGKPAGIIDFADSAIDAHFENGAQFVAVAADVLFLSRGLRGLASKWTGKLRP